MVSNFCGNGLISKIYEFTDIYDGDVRENEKASIIDTEAYTEPCQTSKMECFAKEVNYFCKTLHLRYLTGF